MTPRDALARTTRRLAEGGVETAAVDAEWLLAHVLGVSRSQVLLQGELTPAEEVRLDELTRRRAAREPLAYVLGEWGFRRLTLKVDARALVPRPETEVVVERCLLHLRDEPAPRVLDVGTGSGAIALALLDERSTAHVTALDRSGDALALAAENAASTGLADRLEFVHGDVDHGLPPGPYHLVVANPPYVLEEELGSLDPEVADWEPREALVDRGQTDAVVRGAREVLVPGGWLVVEIHPPTAARVAGALAETGFREVHVERDLAGRERVVEGWAA